jgi:hypothetical protein
VAAVTARRDASAGTGASGGSPDQDAIHAKLLEQALQPLLEGERRVVLDLGEPHAQTVEFFSGLRARLIVGSAVRELVGLGVEDDEGELQRRLKALLPDSQVEGVQVVLAWDVLNYLQPGVVQALMSRLADLLPRGALVHGFLAYGSKVLPETPRALVVQPGCRVRALPAGSTATRKAPGCSTGELQRLMPGFRVERAILLGDGMQECLFRR